VALIGVVGMLLEEKRAESREGEKDLRFSLGRTEQAADRIMSICGCTAVLELAVKSNSETASS
jgi:hypothetical protein